VVAAKPFVATALLALISTAVALGDNPTVKISSADQAKAVAALLRPSDFGAGWRGGRTKTAPITPPSCPGFDPKESDLTVSGHADARFTFEQGGVELDQDVEVLASAAAVQKDFARTIVPPLGPCLAYQLRKSPSVVSVAVAKLPFPPTGSVSAAYRASIVLRSHGVRVRLLRDFVFFGEGRVEYSLNVNAPVGVGDQLVRFELSIATILIKRGAVGTA
jgi:hypothetical protein